MIKDQLSDNSHLLHRQDRLVQALPEPHVKSRKVPLFVGCRALRFRNSERIHTRQHRFRTRVSVLACLFN